MKIGMNKEDDHFYALVYERFWDTMLPALEKVNECEQARIFLFSFIIGCIPCIYALAYEIARFSGTIPSTFERVRATVVDQAKRVFVSLIIACVSYIRSSNAPTCTQLLGDILFGHVNSLDHVVMRETKKNVIPWARRKKE